MNFRRLLPLCHECNSDYKSSKDPLHKNIRPKAFHSFAEDHLPIEIVFSIQYTSTDAMKPEDVDISFPSEAAQEEIETWRDIWH